MDFEFTEVPVVSVANSVLVGASLGFSVDFLFLTTAGPAVLGCMTSASVGEFPDYSADAQTVVRETNFACTVWL